MAEKGQPQSSRAMSRMLPFQLLMVACLKLSVLGFRSKWIGEMQDA